MKKVFRIALTAFPYFVAATLFICIFLPVIPAIILNSATTMINKEKPNNGYKNINPLFRGRLKHAIEKLRADILKIESIGELNKQNKQLFGIQHHFGSLPGNEKTVIKSNTTLISFDFETYIFYIKGEENHQLIVFNAHSLTYEFFQIVSEPKIFIRTAITPINELDDNYLLKWLEIKTF